MNKKHKAPVSDIVRNAHHNVVMVTAQEARTKSADLFGQLNAALEMRDYSKARDVANALVNCTSHIRTTLVTSARASGYAISAYDDGDGDDDDDDELSEGPTKAVKLKRY